LKGFQNIFRDDSRTFGTTDIGRESTLCVERLVNDLPLVLGKSMPDQNCEPGFQAQNGHRQCFSGGNKDARKTASSRDSDWQENEALAIDRQTSVRGSQLLHCKGKEELCPLVR
jgi:hypothetical protein